MALSPARRNPVLSVSLSALCLLSASVVFAATPHIPGGTTATNSGTMTDGGSNSGSGGTSGTGAFHNVDLNRVQSAGTFQSGSGGSGGVIVDPVHDGSNGNAMTGFQQNGGGAPGSGGSGSSGGPGGGPGGGGDGARAVGAARQDILPGQMDALRGDSAGANAPPPAQQASAAPTDGVSVLTRTSPQMLGGMSGGGGRSHASDLMHMAQSKMRLRDYAGAAAVAKQMIAENPKDDKGYTLLSMAANHSKDYATAEVAAKSAVKLNPKNAVALQNQAWAQVHEKKLVEAIEAADEAIKLKPDSAGNYAVKAFAEGMLGKKDAALADLETAASIDPRFMGRLEAARKTGVIFDPDDDDAGLNDDMAGKAGAGAGGAAAPVKVGGLVLLVLGLWAGMQLGRRRAAAKIAPAPIIPLRLPPNS